MTRQAQTTRRSFFRGAAAAALAAPVLVRSSAFGANDRITAGIIGLGGPAGSGGGGAQTIAVCDVREDKIGGRRDDKNLGVYTDFRELLARDDIDCVYIGTPDHWHAIPAIEAAKAGKDIYCEKPMTLTIREGRAMVNAVRQYGRVFQTGSQQRSDYGGCFRFACEMVRSGRIGQLKEINCNVGGPSVDCYLPEEPVPEGLDWNRWLGPAPWRPYNSGIVMGGRWRAWRDYSGGGMTDWGHHHFDIAQWALDADNSGPVEIHPPGTLSNRLTYVYANGVKVYHGGGGGGGVVFFGTEGKIAVDRGPLQSWPESIMKKPLGPDEVHLYTVTNGHKGNFVDCIRTRQRPICDVEVGCRSVTVCHLGNLAYRLNRPLKWDPVKEEFVGDPEANRWLDRPKRAPWTI
ncbi:MAG TPA: Gfo/Idh/MocA family oxidoreductase [Planctomycetota bacterium]|nr:Gfo/Idh/MocA family oxidoreductase [Planctomycetota bacterium]